MIPQKYGIAFTEPRGSLNASSALVNVNMADGSVVVQHGGVEMGQGLHTKIAQVAANTLGIPLELIRVAGNNSDAIVNAPATAASTGFDLNGGAVEKACRVLRQPPRGLLPGPGAVPARTTASSTGDTTGRAAGGRSSSRPGSTAST